MIQPSSPVETGTVAQTPRSTGVRQPAPPPAESIGPAPDLQATVDAINRAARSLNSNVQLSVDAGSGRAVVRVVDSETGDLIRQIPSEEALELRRALERIAGLIIRRTA